MKKLMTFVLSIYCLQSFSQQKPHYTQYILNQYIINPALSGIENYTDVKLSHRHQWTGIDGSPVTTYFSIQGPVGKKDYRTTATSFDVPGENPRGQRYWETYTAAKPHHGLGLQIINDVTGPLSNSSAFATYAYHIGLSPRTNLSAGIGAGVTSWNLNASKLTFANASVDPAVYSTGVLNKLKFDMTAGIYLYSADYFIGLSAQQIVPSAIDYSNDVITTGSGKTVPHFFATGGYRFLINEDLNWTPSLMIKYINPLPLQVETNMKLQYRDLLWAGASYRYKDGFAAMLGLNVFNTFNISYAYDYTTSGLTTYSKGTHELMIGFIIGNKYSDSCPRMVW